MSPRGGTGLGRRLDGARPSERSLRAASMFGLVLGRTAGARLVEGPSGAAGAAEEVRARLLAAPTGRSTIVLVTGPSGAGKSLLLCAVARLLPASSITWASDVGRRRAGSVVDQLDGPLEETLRLLGRAGLADARLFARSVSRLSVGERARLSLALAMDRAGRLRDRPGESENDEGRAEPPTIFIDEFASSLDTTTARSLARTLRRWADEAGPGRGVA